jgi:hypothetical protein
MQCWTPASIHHSAFIIQHFKLPFPRRLASPTMTP